MASLATTSSRCIKSPNQEALKQLQGQDITATKRKAVLEEVYRRHHRTVCIA